MLHKLDEIRFSKQFVLTRAPISFVNESESTKLWQQTRFNPDISIAYHPHLLTSYVSSSAAQLMCLGELFDPDNPLRDNSAILHSILEESAGFDDLEGILTRMAGRWVILARYDGSAFLYHDAGGLKSVFVFQDPNSGNAYAGSQPALMAHLFSLDRNHELEAQVRESGASSWPINAYPYENMAQLLPNHRLNLETFVMERYWPKGPLARVDPDDASAEITRLVRGIVGAALRRRSCHIPLTGGYDSRLLLSCTGQIKDKITYFTVVRPETPRYDRVIPKRLARMCGIRYESVIPAPADTEVMSVLSGNSSDMYLDSSRPVVFSDCDVAKGGYILKGLVSEILRCSYYKDGNHPRITPEGLSKKTGFGRSRIAVEGFRKWLSAYPETNILPLDLAHWEHKVGVWASAQTAYAEALVDILPPMNCRRILETGLGVGIEHRKYPHELYRRMYGFYDTRLLDVPFNRTPLERVVGLCKKRLARVLGG